MVHESAAEGYRRGSASYASARPSYHPAIIDRFAERYGKGRIVELGAGTGIFTKQLAAAGVGVVAVEPVAEMRSEMQAALRGVHVIGGMAEAIGLRSDTVDTVVAAQSFHWFDHERTLPEIRRVLRPGGHVVCVWNVRDDGSKLMRDFTAIVDRHAGDTPRHRSMTWRRAIEADEHFRLIEDVGVANPVAATPESVEKRALSTSFIAALPAGLRSEVVEQIRELTRPLGRRFDFPYRCELQAWAYEP